MIDVMRILGTRPEKFEARIDELASRLVAGEKVEREEVKAFLDRTETTPEELQTAIDRLQRRRELLATIRDAKPARRRASDIEAEIAAAQADVDKATDILTRIREKYREKLTDLRIAIETADRAAVALVEYRNLPPSVAARLKEARDAADQASAEVDQINRDLPRLRGELREAEEALATERETLAMNRRDPRVQDQVDRATRRVKACEGRLKDAEQSLVDAGKAVTEARRNRDRVTADITTKYGQE